MKRYFAAILCLLLLTGCAAPEDTHPTEDARIPAETLPLPTTPPEETAPAEPLPPDPIGELLASMPLEDWVGQLFLVGADPNLAEEHILTYKPAGFLLFAGDFENNTPGNSAWKKIQRWQSTSPIPLLIATDEEGGTVTRVSCHSYYRHRRFYSPRRLYDTGGMEAVMMEEKEKCELLASVGVNVNLGPVCDITTDPEAFLYDRSLGQDARTTANYVTEVVSLKCALSMGTALKHFPGYGNNADTHTGIAVDSRSLEALEGADLIPFRAGIEAGAGCIMVSHTVVEALDADLPASLSPAVSRYLREEMGFAGVILTDDLTMQAIADRYGTGEAAVMAIQNGSDLLCSSSFTEQYDAVLQAVLEGRIDFDTLKAAVRNVLEWKMELGLI